MIKKHFRIAVVLLLLFWVRLVDTAVTVSATFDEPLHLMQAVLYWRQRLLMSVVQNPPLVHVLMGLPLRLAFEPALPPEMTGAVFQDWLALSRQFLWQINGGGLQLLFAGRLAVIWLALLLGALLVRWAGRWFGPGAALVTLLLYTFDPNVLAHGALATTDLGTAVFITLAAYSVWSYWTMHDAGRDPRRGQYWLVGAAVGLALASKFSGVILLPALGLIVVWRMWTGQEQRGWQRPLLELAGWLVMGTAVFLLIYRFDWTALSMDFSLQQAHQLEGHSSFLLGQMNVGGWWYYFPVLFAVKTPLPFLLLLLVGLALFWGQRPWQQGGSWAQGWLWLLAGGLAGASLLSRVNIGYRYLLPVLPLLFVLVAGVLWRGGKMWRWVMGVGLFWLAAESLWFHPHYLAYFNQIAGGPASGWRVAVDSNLDWGQDIAALATYEKTHLLRSYQAAWLGTAPLSVYGVERGQPMAVWPQGREDDLSDNFYPPAPAPGQYVISATQLQGVYLKNPARFAWFLAQTPHDRIGYSLFVYDVPATGAPVGLGLSGIGLPMIEVSDYQQTFQSNDVTPRWFDARTTFLWPGGEEIAAWTAVGDGHRPTHPLLAQFYPTGPDITGESKVDGRDWRYHLYAWPDSPLVSHLSRATATTGLGGPTELVQGPAHHRLEETAVFGDTFELLGYQVDGETADQSLDLLTFWRVTQPPFTDLKIFVHLLAEDGQIVAQHDALDVRPQGLQPGDEMAQLHIIPLPESLPSGQYVLQIGLYWAGDFSRLTVPVKDGVIDRILGPTIRLNR